jgi:ABC-2 type transport system permease protein
MKIKMENLSGTRALIRLIFSRDRIILPVLFLFLILLFVSIAASFVNLYADAALREALVLQISSNPGIVLILGPIQDSSVGGLVAWRSAVFGPILVALVNIFLMIRHTRSEERKGRLEILNSTAVGRQATLTSALITICGANMLLGILIFLSFLGLGLPWEGSLALALSMVVFGCLFAAITAVMAQLTESSSEARYLSVAILIAFFILRSIGWDEGGANWVFWLSPLGWVQNIRAFAGEEWWIFGLFAVLTIGLLALAYYLSSVRDLGAGILPQRSGPERASLTLASTMGLTWRLQRGMLLFWIAGFALMGVFIGFSAQTVSNIFTDNPQFLNIISQIGKGTEPLDTYINFMLVLFGQVFAIYGILSALKLRSQEVKKYSELLLTNTVSKTKWALSNLFFALIGPAIIMAIFISCYSLSYGLISGNMGQNLPQLLSAALVYLPAIWVMVGISVALFGILPRLTSLSWVALGLLLIINLLADFLDIDQWILNISPFTHVPNLLLGDTVGWPLGIVLVVALVLILVGMVGFHRRDIA